MEYFPRIHHIATLQQSPRVPVENERRARRIYRTDHLHVDVQRHLMETPDNGQECELSAQLVSFMREVFHQENGHSSNLDQKRIGILLMVADHTENGTEPIHFCADEVTIETVFRTIISVNQLSIHGAVSDLCEEYKACHVRTV